MYQRIIKKLESAPWDISALYIKLKLTEFSLLHFGTIDKIQRNLMI